MEHKANDSNNAKMGTREIHLELSLDSQVILASAASDSGPSVGPPDLERSILKSMQTAFQHGSEGWIDSFVEQVTQGDTDEAFQIFERNRWFLQFLNNPAALSKLRSLDSRTFQREQRKEFILTIVAICSRLGLREGLDKEIDGLLDEFRGKLEPIVVQNLLLEKGNIAAINGFHNTANVLFKGIAESDDADDGTKAWALQGLSKIAGIDDDFLHYAQRAVDRHMISGHRLEAVKNLYAISRIKASSDPQGAIEVLEQAIDIYSTNSLLDREFAAALWQMKSGLLLSVERLKDALSSAERACELRRGLIGNEVASHSSLCLAALLSERIGDQRKTAQYKTEAEDIAKGIQEEAFRIRLELAQIVDSRSTIDPTLEKRICEVADEGLHFGYFLYKSTQEVLPREEKFRLLDMAKAIAQKNRWSHDLSTVCFMIAEEYRKNKALSDALRHYTESLENNQFNRAATQNCIHMLLESAMWQEAESFIKERLDVLGNLPNLSLAYAKALLKQGKCCAALPYLQKAEATPEVNEMILGCVRTLGEGTIQCMQEQPTGEGHRISLPEFKSALAAFSESISSDSRMHFWSYSSENKGYKWCSHPEEQSKQMLIAFLNGRFGKDTVELLQEPRTGAGFIDLYVLLRGGLKVVIELKMCGGGYSSSYALSGESQIVHYLSGRDTKVGYLIVFDGRLRDYGRGFHETQSLNDFTIYTLSVDMRPVVKATNKCEE